MVNDDRINKNRISKVPVKIHRKTKIRFWGLFYKLVIGEYNPLRINPLFILFIFGMGGILIDLDHFIIKELQMLRPLHLPYWIICGVFCICYCTYIYRRFYKSSINSDSIESVNDRMS